MRPVFRSAIFLVIAVGACDTWLWLYSGGELSRKAEALMRLEVSKGHFSGAVLVSRGTQILFEGAYGDANAEWHVPNTTGTKFEIGSITKPFTAVLVMQLEQERRVTLNDSICLYLVPCPSSWSPITLRHLLSHTSGIFNLTNASDFDAQRATTQTSEQIVARFRDAPLGFVPGTKFQYSNSNYFLLGLVIEKVTGQPYARVLQQRILDPLEMHDTGVIARSAILRNRASGYELNGSGHLENISRPMDPSWSFAAGAMYSTVEDLQKWNEALSAGVLLPRETLARMWQPVQPGYGYGWMIPLVDRETLSRRIVEHGGREPGFVSFFSRTIDDGLAVIVLSNQISSNPARIVRGLSAIALGEPYISPLTREPVSLTLEVLRRYEGEYELDGKTWVVRARDGRLFARYQNLPELEILPDSDTTFFFRELDGGLRVMQDSQGRVTAFLLTPGGQVAKKVR